VHGDGPRHIDAGRNNFWVSSAGLALRLTAEHDFRDLVPSNPRADQAGMRAWSRARREGPAIGQDQDGALGIEKADHVIVIGDAAASVTDVAQTRAAEREQCFALRGVAVRKDIRDPAETIVN
jgi:hypothetical protein